MDTIALVDKYPSEDERVIAHQISRGGGGPAAVAAVALARLGISTAIVGTIGKDSDALEILNIFQREGVNTSGIAIADGPTAGSVIVASRERSSRAINTLQPMTQAPLTSSAKSLISNTQWIHCDHVGITRLDEMGVTRGAGPNISFDAGYGVEEFDSSLVDLFVPTDRMIALRHPGLSLETGVTFDAMTAKNICVATLGSKGSVAYSEASGFVSSNGFSVDVLSTLGAGDVFHGALLAQIIQERPLKEAIRRANAAAAMSCQGLDGQSAIPHTDELNSFLEART